MKYNEKSFEQFVTSCINSHGKYFWENKFAECGLVNKIKSKVTQGLDLTGHRRLLY